MAREQGNDVRKLAVYLQDAGVVVHERAAARNVDADDAGDGGRGDVEIASIERWERAMPLIGEFVDRRWADAKEELRKQDPDYVRTIETRGQSEQDWLTPTSGLPSKWHDLLASCDELHLLASMVQAAAMGLTPYPYLHGDLTSVAVGQLSTYNGRSWFVHAKALAERAKDVIHKTVEVYICDSRAAKEMAERHCKAVRCRVEAHRVQFEQEGTIRELRNEFAHGNEPSWARVIAEIDDDHGYLWEAFIARGLTPRRRLEEGFFSTIGEKTSSGEYSLAIEDTKELFERIAYILHELEEDISAHNGQPDRRDVEGER